MRKPLWQIICPLVGSLKEVKYDIQVILIDFKNYYSRGSVSSYQETKRTFSIKNYFIWKNKSDGCVGSRASWLLRYQSLLILLFNLNNFSSPYECEHENGCATVGTVVTSNTWVRIQPLAIFKDDLFTVNWLEKTKITKKRPRMAHKKRKKYMIIPFVVDNLLNWAAFKSWRHCSFLYHLRKWRKDDDDEASTKIVLAEKIYLKRKKAKPFFDDELTINSTLGKWTSWRCCDSPFSTFDLFAAASQTRIPFTNLQCSTTMRLNNL